MSITTNDTCESMILQGLDGSNPLGFLAALGTLRVLGSSIRMKWIATGGTWVPSVSAINGQLLSEDAVINGLSARFGDTTSQHPASVLERLRAASPGERRQLFVECHDQTSYSARFTADWLAALASDVSSSNAVNQLQTSRRDYFLRNLTSIVARTTKEHLYRTLFCPWDYADPLENLSLHLDPTEDRRHAHQWNQPSGDPNRKKTGGMLGANRLAIEAMPLFTSIPEGDRLHTTGFAGNRSTDTRWTWPIWSVSVGVQYVRSILSMRILQADRLNAMHIRMLQDTGIAAVFRTNRILVGKTPNFTPARCIL